MRKLEFGELVGSLGKALLSPQMWPSLESSSWRAGAKIKIISWISFSPGQPWTTELLLDRITRLKYLSSQNQRKSFAPHLMRKTHVFWFKNSIWHLNDSNRGFKKKNKEWLKAVRSEETTDPEQWYLMTINNQHRIAPETVTQPTSSMSARALQALQGHVVRPHVFTWGETNLGSRQENIFTPGACLCWQREYANKKRNQINYCRDKSGKPEHDYILM